MVLSYTAHKSLADSTSSEKKNFQLPACASFCTLEALPLFGMPREAGQCQPLEKDIGECGGKDRYECCKQFEGSKAGHLRKLDICKMLSVALTQIYHAGLLVFARFFAGQEIATDTLPVCLSQPRSL